MFAAFKSSEIGVAAGFALLVEGALAALLIWANASKSLTPEKEPEVKEIPIAVQPVLDELPLLKLGSKVKPKLPEMWRKPQPRPRYEDKTAASTKAEKTLEKPVEKELQKASKEIPPDEKAELAKQVEEQLKDEPDQKEAKLSEDGAEDGVKEGTETDPLKAFVLDQYRKRLISWFQSGFSPTSDACDAKLVVVPHIGADGTVTSFAVNGSSGNAGFDGRVKSHMQGKVGNQVPPPPPNHPGILSSGLSLRFSGEKACGSKPKVPSGGGDESPPKPEEPADKPEPVEAPAPSPEGE